MSMSAERVSFSSRTGTGGANSLPSSSTNFNRDILHEYQMHTFKDLQRAHIKSEGNWRKESFKVRNL